jgi:anti-anti-sigma regulatory factor
VSDDGPLLEATEDELEQRARRLEVELARVRAVTEELDEMSSALIERGPSAVLVVERDGRAWANLAGVPFLDARMRAPRAPWLGFFGEQYGPPLRERELPWARASAMETTERRTLWARTREQPEGVWVEVTADPVGDGSVLATIEDVTERRARSEDLAASERAIAREERAVEQLEASFARVDLPIVPLGRGGVVVPLRGRLDAARAERLERALVLRRCADGLALVIVDLDGGIVASGDPDAIPALRGAIGRVRRAGIPCLLAGSTEGARALARAIDPAASVRALAAAIRQARSEGRLRPERQPESHT